MPTLPRPRAGKGRRARTPTNRLRILLSAAFGCLCSFARAAGDGVPDIAGPQFDPAKTVAYMAGRTAGVMVTVQDQGGVAQVIVFYRTKGARQPYRSLSLEQSGTHMYETDLPEAHTRAPGLEYYFEAQDQTGNRTRHGDPDQPLILTIAPDAAPAPEPSRPEDAATDRPGGLAAALADQPARSKTPRWVWIVLGSVVAGGAAAAIHNDDGDKGRSGRGEEGVVTVSGPLP